MSQTLQNRYTLIQELGRGTYGIVHKATDTQTGHTVAVKGIENERIFLLEVEAMKALPTHQGLVRLRDSFKWGARYYIVMDFIEGISLLQLCRQGITTETAFQITHELVSAVIAMHSVGLSHRDIKLDNIIVRSDGHIVLLDYGFVTSQAQRSKSLVGSIHYIPPEVLSQKPYESSTADSWSLGVVVYALFTQSLPFIDDGRSTLRMKILTGEFELPENLPTDLRKLIRKLLETDPNKRCPVEAIIRDRFWSAQCKKYALPVLGTPAEKEQPSLDSEFRRFNPDRKGASDTTFLERSDSPKKMQYTRHGTSPAKLWKKLTGTRH